MKLEKLCPFFRRMDALYGGRQNIIPTVTMEPGGIVKLNSKLISNILTTPISSNANVNNEIDVDDNFSDREFELLSSSTSTTNSSNFTEENQSKSSKKRKQSLPDGIEVIGDGDDQEDNNDLQNGADDEIDHDHDDNSENQKIPKKSTSKKISQIVMKK
jgi:hypothetical protein